MLDQIKSMTAKLSFSILTTMKNYPKYNIALYVCKYIFHFNIVGRDYKGRNFTNIRCWRITEDDSPQDKPNQVEQKTTYISTQTNTEQDDDLPF